LNTILQPMRKPLSIVTAVLLVLPVTYLIREGYLDLTQFFTQLAVGLLLMAVGILYWGFRPEIQRWFGGTPKFNITLTDLKPEEKIREVQIRFRGGEVRKHEARFCYITVRNSGKRTAEDVVAWCGTDRMMFMPIRRKLTYTVDHDDAPEDFDEEVKISKEAYIFALLREDKLKETVTIHPGPIGEAFVLFFTLKDFPQLCIPGFTRIYRGIPCTKHELTIYLRGEHMSDSQEATFEVTAKSWDSFEVKQIGQTVRRPSSWLSQA